MALDGGKVTFGIRPLENTNFTIQSRILSFFNVEVLHENVFYLDENKQLQNRGFFADGVRADRYFPDNISAYRFEQPFVPNESAGTFLRGLEASYSGVRYNFIFYNCQGFAERARKGLR